MKNFLSRLLLLVFFLLPLTACKSEETTEEATAEEATAEEATDESAAAEANDELPLVEVADDGTEFDPPVQPEQLPDGVYYCDMGTVHYARAQNSQHRCPLCNMMLTYKGDAAAHDHSDDDHHHDHAHDAAGHDDHDHSDHDHNAAGHDDHDHSDHDHAH